MGSPEVGVIVGPARSGKTAALARRVRGLAQAGVTMGEVLVLAPSHDAADELRRRLADELGDLGLLPAVRSVRELAHAFAGLPRVLTPAERSLALVDARARGHSAAQVSAALADVSAAWEAGCLPHAGDACSQALLAALTGRGSVPPESLAARALERMGRGTSRVVAPVRHVLADDADLMTAGELRLARSLARECLVLTAEAGLAPSVEPAWCQDLALTETRLGAATAHVVKWVDAQEEAAGVAAFVDLALRRLGCDPSEAFVVCPHRAARPLVTDALARAGLAAADADVLPGDPRDPAACRALRIYAGLRLVADATDVGAWRVWCATGHADLSAAAWATLESHAAAEGVGVVRALASLAPDRASEPFPGAARLAAEYAAALDFVGRCGGKAGRALIEAADPAGTPALRRLVCADGRGAGLHEGAGELVARASARIADARFSPGRGCVRVGSPAELAGLHPRVLAFVGANEGVCADADVLSACDRSCDCLLVSYVQRLGADDARRLGARVRRERREGDVRVALLAPSPGLAALGADQPSTMSGQQFCAAVLGLRP